MDGVITLFFIKVVALHEGHVHTATKFGCQFTFFVRNSGQYTHTQFSNLQN